MKGTLELLFGLLFHLVFNITVKNKSMNYINVPVLKN